MRGRHRRRSTMIRAIVKGSLLCTVALFMILGWLWIYLDMH